MPAFSARPAMARFEAGLAAQLTNPVRLRILLDVAAEAPDVQSFYPMRHRRGPRVERWWFDDRVHRLIAVNMLEKIGPACSAHANRALL